VFSHGEDSFLGVAEERLESLIGEVFPLKGEACVLVRGWYKWGGIEKSQPEEWGEEL